MKIIRDLMIQSYFMIKSCPFDIRTPTKILYMSISSIGSVVMTPVVIFVA